MEGVDDMGSKIFETILKRKIDNFISTYGEDSNSLFKNVTGKLIHPGEYGMYREECLKELLRCIIDKNMAISDGFIISANEEVSTQCDIIIYDSNVNPLIDNNIAKFYPMEIVHAIGEVKSDLDKNRFKEAIIKMANNKKLFSSRCLMEKERECLNIEFNYPLSFLVCKKLNFDINQMSVDEIKDMYEGIPREYWHNAILSVEDGVIMYNMIFRNFPPEMLQENLYLRVNNDTEVYHEYPMYSRGGNEIYYPEPEILLVSKHNIYKHILYFLAMIRNGLEQNNKFEYDFGEYLNLNNNDIFGK